MGFGARMLSPNSDSRSRRRHGCQKEHERQNRTPDPCHCSSVSSLGSGKSTMIQLYPLSKQMRLDQLLKKIQTKTFKIFRNESISPRLVWFSGRLLS